MANVVYDKSFEFALKIISLFKYLCDDKKEYVISKQILRSSTSVGANIKEAMYGQSKKDFLSKINIALKEAAETEYWLEILIKSKYISEKRGTDLLLKCREIIKILSATSKTTKMRLDNKE